MSQQQTLFKKICKRGSVLGVILFLGCHVPSKIDATTLTTGPYLQRQGDTAITVMANTDTDEQVRLRYRRVGATNWKKTTLSSAGTAHRFRLTGLRPDHAYEYYVRNADGDRLTPTLTFHTIHPLTKDTPIKIAVEGDSGTNTVPQYQVANQMQRFDPDFILHTGDIAYDVGSVEQYLSSVFLPYQSLFAQVPFYGSIGNHDFATADAAPYKSFFETPHSYNGTEDYYAFDYDDVHIISLNANMDYSVGSDQYTWLRADLKASHNRHDRWTIVFFHQPVYSSGHHGSEPGMAEILTPLFENYGVDIVLNGHDHDYERNETVDGVDYLVTGGGGANSLYTQEHPELNPYSKIFISTYHFVSLTVYKRYIQIQAVDNTGQVIDQFKIKQDQKRYR